MEVYDLTQPKHQKHQRLRFKNFWHLPTTTLQINQYPNFPVFVFFPVFNPNFEFFHQKKIGNPT